MTRGFYEQLGTSRDAAIDELRSAYTRVVTQLIRRRKAIIEQGGDPSQLDLDRAQLEEAWDVVSDPERRRKYDAMLAVMDDDLPESGEELWEKVRPAFADPAAEAARGPELRRHGIAGQLATAATEYTLRAPFQGWQVSVRGFPDPNS